MLGSSEQITLDTISYEMPRTDIERWAEAHNLSPDYVVQLAREGRIEGAYKDGNGVWKLDAEARRLPPTDLSRQKWKKRYESYGREYQRRYRAQEKMRAERALESD